MMPEERKGNGTITSQIIMLWKWNDKLVAQIKL